MNEPRPKWTIAHPSSQFLYEKKKRFEVAQRQFSIYI